MNLRRCLPGLIFLWLIAGGTANAQNPDFDHLSTGFALDGAHSSVSCEGCHANANFTATRSSCESCHSNGGTVRASAKPADHVLTSHGNSVGTAFFCNLKKVVNSSHATTHYHRDRNSV